MTVPVFAKLPARRSAGGRILEAVGARLPYGIATSGALTGAFIRKEEEEELVPHDGAAQRAAERIYARACPWSDGPAENGGGPASSASTAFMKVEPLKMLVPLLICTLTAAPPAMPWSASKALVTTLMIFDRFEPWGIALNAL